VLLKLVIPAILDQADTVQIESIDIAENTRLMPGAQICEFTSGIDLADMHDCPPTTTYRMTSSENAWVRTVSARPGDQLLSGDILAVLSTGPDDPLDGQEERRARNTIAAIFKPVAW